MRRTLVTVADASRARIFRLDPAEDDEESSVLVERKDVVHPAARLRQGERYSGSTPRSGHPRGAGHDTTWDDHRDEHDVEDVRRFVHHIIQALAEEMDENPVDRLVVVATHKVFPWLTRKAERELGARVKMECLTGELTQLTVHELTQELRRRRLIP